MAFVWRLRLEGAREELLTAGQRASVSEIAARWNFVDASHFMKRFKSAYGMNPQTYQREYDPH